MHALGWMLVIAAPPVLSATLGLLLPRAWQRILASGVACAALYAAGHYWLQSELIPRSAAADVAGHQPSLRAAIGFALLTLPVGLLAGFVFHLFSRFIRTHKA